MVKVKEQSSVSGSPGTGLCCTWSYILVEMKGFTKAEKCGILAMIFDLACARRKYYDPML
jgi:hypothetical protein